MKITGINPKAAKVLISLAVIGGGIWGVNKFILTAPKDAKESQQIAQVTLPDAPEASLSGNALKLEFPAEKSFVTNGTKVDWKIMAWNSQMAAAYCNGGAQTKQGSLFAKQNLMVNFTRQDDCNQSCADLVAFAKAYKENPESTNGLFITFMGDGMPAFMTNLSKELEPLGEKYQPVIVMTFGKSFGEDQVMAPMEWKTNPSSALGKTVAGVERDGDLNILFKWAADNALKINPDPTTYDENAINIIAASTYLDAANKYINDYQETRKRVINGKVYADSTIVVGVDAVATWTPGDVNVATKRGGLVTLVSTKEYASQMPNMTITIRKWADDHREDIENMIVALAQGGDQVRSFDDAKKYAARASYDIYKEESADYWYKYYNGVQFDKHTRLGGSMVFNLADMVNFWGLGQDRVDRYKIVYDTFGNIMTKLYPDIMPTYLPYKDAVDKSFLSTVVANHPELLDGKALEVEYAENITQSVSSRNYKIQFETGSAVIKNESKDVLEDIFDQAMVAEGLKIGVYGYTDDIGDATSNQHLSELRANSVREFLESKGIKNYRVEAKGFGEDLPINCENTKSGNNPDRRVVNITLGE